MSVAPSEPPPAEVTASDPLSVAPSSEPSSEPTSEPSQVPASVPATEEPGPSAEPSVTVTATVTAPASSSCGTADVPCSVTPSPDAVALFVVGLSLAVFLLAALVALGLRSR